MSAVRMVAAPGLGRLTVLCTLVLAAPMLAYGLLVPLNSGPDESYHLLRAAGVVRGDLVPPRVPTPRGDLPSVTAPRSYADAATGLPCFLFRADVTADCAPALRAVPGVARVGSTAGRYPPLYYAAVGLPTLVLPDAGGVRLARALDAVLLALLLGQALALALLSRWRAGLVPGLLVATTPMVVYLGGVINPSSLEVGAAVLLWVAGLELAASGPMRRHLVWQVGVSAALLCSARAVGPLLLAGVGTVLLTQAGAARTRALLHRSDARAALVVVVLSLGLSATWTALAQPNDTSVHLVAPVQATAVQAVRGSVGMWSLVSGEMIGNIGYNESPVPVLVLQTWALLLGGLLVLAAVGSRRRWLGLGLCAGSVLALQLAVQVPNYGSFGLGWQGRYDLPLAVGVPLLAGVALTQEDGGTRLPGQRLGRLVAGVTGAAQIVAFVHCWRRYAVGVLGPLDPRRGAWQPPLGGVLLTGVVVAALGGLALLVGRDARPAALGPFSIGGGPAAGSEEPLTGPLDDYVGARCDQVRQRDAAEQQQHAGHEGALRAGGLSHEREGDPVGDVGGVGAAAEPLGDG